MQIYCTVSARQIIDSMGGLYYNLTEPYPEFDLTERLIKMRRLDTTPLFRLGINFDRHVPNTVLLDISPPVSPLLISQKDSVDVITIYNSHFIIYHKILSSIIVLESYLIVHPNLGYCL